MLRRAPLCSSRPLRSSLLVALTLLSLGSVTTASRAEGPHAAPTATELPASDEAQRALSRHLKASGALFYGAWWCPACARQKALFGREAVLELPYVECDKVPDDRDRCNAAKIEAFPTWVLKGKPRLVGVQSLDELRSWSGYGR